MALALLAPLGASVGCAHAPEPSPPCTAPEPLHVTVKAAPRVNLGERGDALATLVRLYQLKKATKLEQASFDDMMDHDHDALGDDFVSVQEVTVNPGERLTPPLTRAADATVLAAVALFREPSGTSWRVFAKLAAPDPQHCHRAAQDASDARAEPRGAQFVLDENRIQLR